MPGAAGSPARPPWRLGAPIIGGRWKSFSAIDPTRMTRKRLSALVGVAAISFLLGIGYWEYLRPIAVDPGPIGPDSPRLGISDPEYIRIAKTTAEARAFLQKYPHALVAVDRSGSLAVDFWVSPPSGATHIDHLRLRVFLDPRRHRPTKSFIVCAGRLVQQHLLDFLRTEQCLP